MPSFTTLIGIGAGVAVYLFWVRRAPPEPTGSVAANAAFLPARMVDDAGVERAAMGAYTAAGSVYG
jgi:hypothetical protein